MTGATSTEQGGSGLVPAPKIGADNLFLRGDGTWAAPSEVIQLGIDEKSIDLLEDGQTLSLKDFGKQYYKYIPATGTFGEAGYKEGRYELQIVDDNNPWKTGLEPKVVFEDGELVLGWFEPSPVDSDKVLADIQKLETKANNLALDISSTNNIVGGISADVTQLKTDIVNKVNASDVYTKEQTDSKIAEAVVNLDHLTRKTFVTLEKAKEFAASTENPDAYIYMVANGSADQNDQYDEYLYVEGILEKVGAWDVNLGDYVTATDFEIALNNKVDVIPDYELMSPEEKAKLAGIESHAQKNLFNYVNETDFSITDDTLHLNQINVSKVTNLENILNGKADAQAVTTLSNAVTNLSNDFGILQNAFYDVETKVTNLESLLNQGDLYVLKSDYEQDMTVVMDAITWKEMN